MVYLWRFLENLWLIKTKERNFEQITSRHQIIICLHVILYFTFIQLQWIVYKYYKGNRFIYEHFELNLILLGLFIAILTADDIFLIEEYTKQPVAQGWKLSLLRSDLYFFFPKWSFIVLSVIHNFNELNPGVKYWVSDAKSVNYWGLALCIVTEQSCSKMYIICRQAVLRVRVWILTCFSTLF